MWVTTTTLDCQLGIKTHDPSNDAPCPPKQFSGRQRSHAVAADTPTGRAARMLHAIHLVRRGAPVARSTAGLKQSPECEASTALTSSRQPEMPLLRRHSVSATLVGAAGLRNQ
jgi:hypothetical protein